MGEQLGRCMVFETLSGEFPKTEGVKTNEIRDVFFFFFFT